MTERQSTRPSAPGPTRHRLLLELGRGGMGTVFLAVSEGPGGFNKLKVVKHLHGDLASDPAFLTMFLDEARLSARLNHPNVVQTTDVGFDGEHYFIEMEFLEGQSLVNVQRRAGLLSGLPIAISVFLLAETLSGLHYAHELADLDGTPLRVVHRDVSPHNVFVTYDGTVKVLDFGIAKAADSSSDTSTGVVKGKLTYMAPEQAARRAVDRRADIFSVGVMLWEALTGKRLWADTSQALIFDRLESGDITPPRAIAPEVPPALDAICRRALAVDPDARFATAASMQAALEAYLESLDRSGEHGRVTARTVAKTLDDLFADTRTRARAQIDARLKEGTASGAVVSLPALGHEASGVIASEGTASMPRGSTVAGMSTETKSRALEQPDANASRRSLLVGSAIVVAALAAGVGALALRAAKHAPGSATGAVHRECETNRECSAKNGDRAFLCRHDDGACVALESPECKVLAGSGDAANDATIWLGAMFPTTGDDAVAFGTESIQALDLARQDFAKISRGLPSTRAGEPPRPLAILACDDSGDPARAAKHLVDDVRVPAVIGFRSSQEVIDLASSLFIPRGVLALATQNRSALITTLPHPPGSPRFVWRTTISSAQTGAPVASVVANILEPAVRALPFALAKGEPLRVALLRNTTTAGLSVSDALFKHLTFNGKSALENGDSYREFLYGDQTSVEAPPAFAKVVADVLAFRPHVIIYVSFDGITKALLAPIEAGWPRQERFRPRYLLDGYLAGGDEFYAFVGKSADLRGRFLGVNPPATTVANAKLTMHYNETYTPKVSLTYGPGSVYDAFYVLAYAAYAAEQGGQGAQAPLTGATLARAIARLVPPGEAVDVGPANIFEALNVLGAGKNVDLGGASTKLDFDLATGDTAADLAVLCVKTDETGKAIDLMESGVVYGALEGKLMGLPVKCP